MFGCIPIFSHLRQSNRDIDVFCTLKQIANFMNHLEFACLIYVDISLYLFFFYWEGFLVYFVSPTILQLPTMPLFIGRILMSQVGPINIEASKIVKINFVVHRHIAYQQKGYLLPFQKM